MANKYLEKVALVLGAGTPPPNPVSPGVKAAPGVVPTSQPIKSLLRTVPRSSSSLSSKVIGLAKYAELSDENKAVGQAFGETLALAVPAHFAGAALGTALARKFKLGSKKLPFGITGESAAQFGAGQVAGGLADIAALKHSLKGKIGNDKPR